MEAHNPTAPIDSELAEAQRDLRDTLERVNQKVERVEASFRPQAIIRNNTAALSALAALLGYYAGIDERPRPWQWIVIGALLGASIAASHNTSGSDATLE